MNRSLKVAAAIAVSGLLAAASAGAAPRGAWQGMMGGPGGPWPGSMGGPGMLGGRGFDGGYGPGMRGSLGMMGRGFSGAPGWENLKKLDKPLTVETAKQRVASALKDWGYADLAADTVTTYDDGFYVLVKEKTSGKPALEVFVDPTYGTVSAGRGPGTGWNTKYGRGLEWPLPSGNTITADQAKNLVQQWLDRSRDRTAYELKVVELPGYFSVQLMDGGKLSSLAAVNAYTSQIWYRGGRGARFAVAGCPGGR